MSVNNATTKPTEVQQEYDRGFAEGQAGERRAIKAIIELCREQGCEAKAVEMIQLGATLPEVRAGFNLPAHTNPLAESL